MKISLSGSSFPLCAYTHAWSGPREGQRLGLLPENEPSRTKGKKGSLGLVSFQGRIRAVVLRVLSATHLFLVRSTLNGDGEEGL